LRTSRKKGKGPTKGKQSSNKKAKGGKKGKNGKKDKKGKNGKKDKKGKIKNKIGAKCKGKAPRSFFGMTHLNLDLGWGGDWSAVLGAMKDLRIGVTRCFIIWAFIEETQGQYNWPKIDNWVELLARQGITCEPCIHGGNSFTDNSCDASPMPIGPQQVNAYADFVGKVAARYGEKGNFWKERKDVPKRPFKYYEIWNEPNLYENFSCNTHDSKPYAKLLAAAAEKIRKNDKNGKVLFGGIAPLKNDKSFLVSAFKSEKKLKKLVDGVAYHPYAKDAKNAMKNIGGIRTAMKKAGLSPKAPLSFTEYGWNPVEGTVSCNGVKAPQSEEALAKHESEFVREVVAKRKELRILNIMPFLWKTDAGDCQNQQWGVLANSDNSLRAKGKAYKDAVRACS
jgi:hypothetical protein